MDASSEESTDGRRVVLRPSFAVDWPVTRRFFTGTCLVSGGIASIFAWAGYWPVLPFAGLELLALGAALYASARRSLDVEVIDVEGGTVRIERGRGRPEQRIELPRAWCEVLLVPSPHRTRGPRLVIRSAGREIELGGFLIEEQRREAAEELRRCIGPMSSLGAVHSG